MCQGVRGHGLGSLELPGFVQAKGLESLFALNVLYANGPSTGL